MHAAYSPGSLDDLCPSTPPAPVDTAAAAATAADYTLADAQAKAIIDLQHLLDALSHPALASKPWAGALPARVKEALELLEIVRLTIAMSRPADEVIAAADHLLKELRLADTMVQRSRADQLTKTAVRLAQKLAQRVLSSFKEHPPSRTDDEFPPGAASAPGGG